MINLSHLGAQCVINLIGLLCILLLVHVLPCFDFYWFTGQNAVSFLELFPSKIMRVHGHSKHWCHTIIYYYYWWSGFHKPLQSKPRKRSTGTTVAGSAQRAAAPATPTCTNSWSIFICSEPQGCALDSVKRCSYGYSTRPRQWQSEAPLKACLWNWG